jgi:flavorubredoxin
MSAISISDNVWWVGVKDPNLRVFDIVMEVHHGTTYNSYLVKGDKIALIDGVKREFSAEFFDNIRKITPLDRIDYFIINHTEPDHSGAIAELLTYAPNAQVIAGGAAAPFIKAIVNRDLPITMVKDDTALDLGGKKLVFKVMPYMHWPDTIMEFLPENGVLFSCDGFAAHLSFDSVFAVEDDSDLQFEYQYYFDTIMRPFTGYIRRNLPKLDGLDIKMIAPSHGPVYRGAPRGWIDKYKTWCADKSEGRNQITIFSASNYGNTLKLAEQISAGLQRQGFNVLLVDAEVVRPEHAKEHIESSVALLFGTPTFNGDAVKPIWDVVNLVSTVYALGKKAAVFGSYGWGGEGIKLVADRLTGLKMKVYPENFRARLVPSEQELSEVDDFATKVAAFVRG